MNLLILGGTGFVGSRVAKYFSMKSDWSVDAIGASDIDLAHARSVELLRQKMTEKTIVLFCSTISRLKEDSFEAYQKNIAMAYHVAQALTSANYHHIIFCSSIDVYGRPPSDPIITEESRVDPFSYYGLSKFASERILMNQLGHKAKLAILRLPGVYSLDDHDPSVLGTIFNDLKKNKPIHLSGSGKQRRSYLNIAEFSLIVESIISRDWSGLLNVMFSHSASLKEMTEMMKTFLLSTSPIIESIENGTEFDIVVSTTKVSQEFPTISPIPLEQYLKRSEL